MSIIKEFIDFIKHLYQSKNLLLVLAINDFKEQYQGSHLGLLWAVLRPSIFVLTIWFVFVIGFKRNQTEEVPFIIYLLCGFIPWFFFAESVNGGMNAIINNRFLVKKVAFRVNILPLVKIFSALFLHFIFLGILIVVLLIHGYTPNWHWLQLPYYLFCMILLVLGIGWFTSSLRVFTKDISEIIGVILQLGFWVTPIFWQLKMVPEKYLFLMQINPMVYIIDGYRNTFIKQIWFWERLELIPMFLMITLFLLLSGAIVFKRLRPHFGDVL
jgi:ABC-type polysaccharide/polyol phosphate export permease